MTIKQLRNELGLTQVQVAQLAGCTDRQVQRWEAGDAPTPKLVIRELQRMVFERQVLSR